MNNIYVVFLLVVPIAMFFSGFLIARQLRALQNVPVISMMFVERKWLISAVMGIFIGGIFSLIMFLYSKFSAQNILAFVVLSLIASVTYYFGATFGWGKSESSIENVTLANQVQINSLPENIIIDDSSNSVKITINTQKRWVGFAMAFFQLVVVGLCALPIAGLMAISILQNLLPKNLGFLVWILVGGLALYLIYTKFQEAIEYIFDKEFIEIDNLSVKIEKYGSGLKSKKLYSANNIKKITGLFSFGGTNIAIKRSPFINSNMPAFMMWHNRGLKRYRSFGRAIDLADAQRILEIIYAKFPQYKG